MRALHLPFVPATVAALAVWLLMTACSSLPSSSVPVVTEITILRDQAAGYLTSGDEAVRNRQYSQAESFYRLALTSYESVDDLEGQCTALDSLGFLYLQVEKVEDAGRTWDHGAMLAKLTGQAKFTARATANQGRYALTKGNVTKAQVLFDLALADRATLDGAVVAVILQAKAMAYRAQNKPADALALLDEAAGLNEKAKAWQEQASNLYLSASVQSKEGKTPDALVRLEKALALDKRSENVDGIAADLLALATIRSRGTTAEKTQALSDAERSYRTALAANNLAGVGKALKLLVEVSTALDDKSRAARYQEQLGKL
jgi:tetratricopeptide (TPR) repeat protein